MTLIPRRDIVSARYRRNDITAFRGNEFLFLTQRKLHGAEERKRERERKNRQDEVSPVLSGRSLAVALKSCFRIWHVISSSSRQRIPGRQREKEKESEKERERRAFSRGARHSPRLLFNNRVRSRLAEPSPNDRAQWGYGHF